MNAKSHPQANSQAHPPVFSWPSFESLLSAINIPSRDDGRQWIERARIDAVAAQLSALHYQLLFTGDLSLIAAHPAFDPAKPSQLISTHIDSLYTTHHFGPSPWAPAADLLGTFDNSITNAVTLDLMARGALPAQTLIAFTGDEEDDSRGAREVMEILETAGLRRRLSFIFVLDITGEDPRGFPCTLENIFLGRPRPAAPARALRSRKAFAKYLSELIELAVPIHLDAAPDESWEYDEFEMTCVAFCLPARPHPELGADADWDWMHSDRGLLIARDAIPGYASALSRLAYRL